MNEGVLRELLSQVGIGTSNAAVSEIDDSSNITRLVEVEGQRYVWREYRDAADGDRARKEAWLHSELSDRGVPVAKFLATHESGEGEVSALVEWIDGVSLADVPDNAAWEDYGRCLRLAHEVTFPKPGYIVGTTVEDWPSWCGPLTGSLREDLASVAPAFGSIPDSGLVDAVLSRIVPSLEPPSYRLVHNDASAWNVLVRNTPAGWRVSAILDWEFARSGDPAWDLARLEFIRSHDYPTPEGFWRGYGDRPSTLAAYELLIAVWKAGQLRDGDFVHPPTARWAEDYMRHVTERLGDLLLGA